MGSLRIRHMRGLRAELLGSAAEIIGGSQTRAFKLSHLALKANGMGKISFCGRPLPEGHALTRF